MGEILKCEKCGTDKFLSKHHLFSNTKLNRKLYGKKIDDPKNIMILCLGCHTNPKEGLPKLSEIEFCERLNIKPESKTALATAQRLYDENY